MQQILTLVVAVLLFAHSASAQGPVNDWIRVSTQTEVTWISSSFGSAQGVSRSDEFYRATTQLIGAEISPESRFSGLVSVGVVSNVSSHSWDSRRGWIQDDPFFTGGELASVELRANWRLHRFLDVYGGFSRFGHTQRHHETGYMQNLGYTNDVKSYTRYRGIEFGAASRLKRNRFEIGGSADWMPKMTRADGYQQNWTQQYWGLSVYGGSGQTDASAYKLSASARLTVARNLGLTASLKLQNISTPYSNHLFGVTSAHIPETSHWRSLAFGASYGF